MKDATKKQTPTSFADVFLRGAAWMVGMRWIVRALGLISTAILARILLPEDFGVVAMALVVAGLAETLVNFGTEMAVLRDKGADREDFDTAWTIRICQSSFVALLVIGASFFAGEFFGDPRVVPIIQVAALAILIRGLENIGVVLFRKEFNYLQDFLFNFLNKVLAVIISIALALLLRNYWALVYAQLLAALSATLFSYYISGYRPKFSLSRFRKIFGFSQWILVEGMGKFLRYNGDRVFIGRVLAAGDLGIYTLAKEIAQMVTYELTFPITRALFPTLAQFTDDLKRFSRAFCTSLGGSMALAAPAAVGLALVAPEFVPVLLGPGWDDVVPFLVVLTYAGLLQVYNGLCANALLILNRARIVAIISWVDAAFILLCIILAYGKFGLPSVPYAILAGTALAMILYTFFLIRYRVVRLGALLLTLWRTAAACGVMVLTINQTVALLGGAYSDFAMLFIKVGIGGISYAIAILGLWVASGRPSSLESKICGLIARRVGLQA